VQYVRDAEKIKAIKSVEMLSRVAGALLQHRRKMLKSCCKLTADQLGEIKNWPEILNQLGINPEIRPDNLSPEQFVAIANLRCESK
jgi:16S rRNA A1518/A1519 N6-dimethyltransferase RsmA/KsgA/DIM1 with predicted DNA glycosylase/AP lyase activity